ncbi:MAG TPA: DRTGG domain-containing protein [Bacteroidales bacterium]|nr:DRTGG domain-containing protein [Bacteroidales bacterium]
MVILKFIRKQYMHKSMTIKEISERIAGKIICCQERDSTVVEYAFSSDLMSDVLTVEKENMVLITGLTNLQTVRTSEMADINCIIIARDKKVNNEIISLAQENNIVLIQSPYSVFRISGELYKAGIKPLF